MLQRFAGVFVGLLFVGNSAWAQEQPPLLAAIFSDHGVLQRDRPIEVWGRAQPGEQVTVAFDNETRKAQADAGGAWAVTLPAMRSGGTHALTARTATRSQTVRDLVIGDVWLCSGQSNMEFKVHSALNASWEAAHSADNGIRHVAIPRFAALAPRADFAGPLEWKVAAPDTTPDFSAVCYFFARELERTASVDVPQGMIHASWGGTRIETWLSPDALRQLGADDAKLALLGRYAADREAGSAEWGRELQKWWNAQPANRGVEPWSTGKASGTWTPAPAKLVPWENWGVPELAEYDGALWYRAHVKLTAAQAKQAAKISLGVIDDVDEVWINAQPFATGFGEVERSYDVPAKLLKAGDNIVVVNVFDMWGSGGLHGDAGQFALHFADGSSVPLGAWEYQQPPKGIAAPPRAPWEPIAGVGVLYNGMIAPLGKYGLRGVAWYQGESNAGLDDALRYQKQLQMLFTDWRRQFDNPLPFFVVQLANYEDAGDHPRGQRLGATARCAASCRDRGRECGPRGHHRHRQSRRHPPDQQARRGQAAGARRAARGVRGKDLAVGRRAPIRAACRRRSRCHAGRLRREPGGDRSEGPRGFRALRRPAGELPLRACAAGRGRSSEARRRGAGESHARALLLGRRAVVQLVRHHGTAGGAVRDFGSVAG